MKKEKVEKGEVKQLLSQKLAKHPKVLEELDLLFDMAPPSYLKKSLTHLFFAYLCNTEVEYYPMEMKEIATDFHTLIRFLEIAEIYEKEFST